MTDSEKLHESLLETVTALEKVLEGVPVRCLDETILRAKSVLKKVDNKEV